MPQPNVGRPEFMIVFQNPRGRNYMFVSGTSFPFGFNQASLVPLLMLLKCKEKMFTQTYIRPNPGPKGQEAKDQARKQ